ncbi:2-isopropylmalate synthase [Nitratiruptor sp. YY08-26]|uniref:2-isopropylmalate synthase n=1 Tax=unclassified Nitratiruptor TaxID=2624044 RepID=UPI001915AC35|nr:MULTISPECIES: 2-isopropylmalate synthase [unclassified Nitratiruptor]BCD62701.1 2-isopropylmalate synthase [Nitratiruptor sp. YY08-13]BCD66637.1 2-isopropylmalate synthase [Nitratiruptor sp. YY08-26]
MKEQVKIFDTTLRDGEQSPGASMNTEEKIQIAKQLEKLGVDIIEAGFAAASPGDFEAIRKISEVVSKSTVCSLARALEKDIKAAGEAIAPAKFKRIHTFIATSPIHMKYKLRMEPEEVIKKAVEAVKYAKTFVDDVEFSCEDAGRSEMAFLKEIIAAVIEAGAKTINIPDTVGYRFPHEMGEMIKELKDFIGERAIISVHCHNDLGLAVANSLYSVLNGARQVECTINGLGERAGNAALEEIVMAIKTRKDIFDGIDTNINTKEIYPTSRLVAAITGIEPQPNKAIVGKNAFAHESGIHQDGVLKHQETYEIMRAEDIGLDRNAIVLGKHSGRHAFKKRIEDLGFTLSEEEINKAFERFKVLADKKKEITDDDIRMLITNEIASAPEVYKLKKLQISDCSEGVPSAAVTIEFDGKEITDAGIGDGTIDAIFKTIDRISGYKGTLNDYQVAAVSKGKDALAKVVVKVVFDEKKPAVIGHGLSIDTMIASAKAYVSALNSYISMKDMLKVKKGCDSEI